jgi:Winged helix-turn helix
MDRRRTDRPISSPACHGQPTHVVGSILNGLDRSLIGREFGVRLSEVSVGRQLRRLSLSPQRPLYRAYQQNPEAVARWKAETDPQLRTQAACVGATIYFADEAGVRSDYHTGPPGRRSAAPR